MIQRNRGTEVDTRGLVRQESAGRTSEASTVAAWNPAARIAVMLMLGILSGADIWIFTMAKISSLPGLHVHVGAVKLGSVLFRTLVG